MLVGMLMSISAVWKSPDTVTSMMAAAHLTNSRLSLALRVLNPFLTSARLSL